MPVATEVKVLGNPRSTRPRKGMQVTPSSDLIIDLPHSGQVLRIPTTF
jgi:hypothetical protein